MSTHDKQDDHDDDDDDDDDEDHDDDADDDDDEYHGYDNAPAQKCDHHHHHNHCRRDPDWTNIISIALIISIIIIFIIWEDNVGVCCVCLQMFRSVQMPRAMPRSVI
jgi:hypothetical protein